MKWILLILGITANTCASIMVKLAMQPPRKLISIEQPLLILNNWPLWLGLVLYFATFLFYAATLARLPLNVAHPILTSGAIVTVALCSIFFFRETFYWTTVLGIILVITGVALITAQVD